MKYYLHCFKHYFDFSGRASRREMWIFALVNLVLGCLLVFINNRYLHWNFNLEVNFEIILKSLFTGYSFPYIAHYYELYPEARGMAIFPFIFYAVTLIPTFAVEVRRLHDINLGWLHFIPVFIPIIGWIWWIVFGCIRGSEGANKYGEREEI